MKAQAATGNERAGLPGGCGHAVGHGRFFEKMKLLDPLLRYAEEVKVLQVNVGYLCNMACTHCHIERGRGRPPQMDLDTMLAVLRAVEREGIRTVDITGGAPELNPGFRGLVSSLAALACRVMVRTNLTVFYEEGMEDLPDFYARHRVEVVASLPCYTKENVDRVRGRGAFEKSIRGLRRLNQLGYGTGGELALHLVYNPGGAFLPPDQSSLEEDYHRELSGRYGVVFDRLYALANMPLGRFRDVLLDRGDFDRYMTEADRAFNAGAVPALMCRHLVSVAPDGALYDCDFNQMSRQPLAGSCPRHINEFDAGALRNRLIAFQDYCLVCAAASGST